MLRMVVRPWLGLPRWRCDTSGFTDDVMSIRDIVARIDAKKAYTESDSTGGSKTDRGRSLMYDCLDWLLNCNLRTLFMQYAHCHTVFVTKQPIVPLLLLHSFNGPLFQDNVCTRKVKPVWI